MVQAETNATGVTQPVQLATGAHWMVETKRTPLYTIWWSKSTHF